MQPINDVFVQQPQGLPARGNIPPFQPPGYRDSDVEEAAVGAKVSYEKVHSLAVLKW